MLERWYLLNSRLQLRISEEQDMHVRKLAANKKQTNKQTDKHVRQGHAWTSISERENKIKHFFLQGKSDSDSDRFMTIGLCLDLS